MEEGRRGSSTVAVMVAWWQCASREKGAETSYIGKRACREGASLRHGGIQALMLCTAVGPRQSRMHREE
jgi:hypothetical protein